MGRVEGRSGPIRYAVVRSSLGWVLVGSGGRGICVVELGDGPGELVAGLRGRFGGAEVVEDAAGLEALTRAVVAEIEAPGTAPLPPLDPGGTAFQRRVWEALRAIPAGATTTYGELARQLGRPTAARAVAGAVAANPIAVLVPCHRVVRQGGALGGYRWGPERKRALLDREAHGPGRPTPVTTPGRPATIGREVGDGPWLEPTEMPS